MRDVAPDEGNVAYYLGKAYRWVGMNKEATQQFAYAQDLDPKYRTAVAEIMQKEGEGLEEGLDWCVYDTMILSFYSVFAGW